MRGFWVFLVAIVATAPVMAAPEQGLVIHPGELMAQPFLDAAKTGPVMGNEPVTIVERRGGWVSVEANGKTGWLRVLNLRLAPSGAAQGAGRPTGNSLSSSASLLRTGSSGQTVTTGIKGLGEENIRNAAVDPQQLAKLTDLGVPEAEARATAARKKLAESKVDYLRPGREK